MNRIIGAGHSEYEWTIWSECKKGTQQRERLKQGGKSGKDFETKLCSKGFPTPKPPYRGLGVSGVPIELVRYHIGDMLNDIILNIPSSETGLDYGDVNPGANPGVNPGVN